MNAEIVVRLADLPKHDPELAGLRGRLRQAFPPIDPAEFASQRQNLDNLYLTAIRREAQGLSPTEVNVMKAEDERVRQKVPLPPEGMDASLPKPLQKLRAIYRQQLAAQDKKETEAYLTLTKSIQSYMLPLQQKRAADGDVIGAGCVTAVMKEWQSGKDEAAASITSSQSSADLGQPGTPTRRPNRVGSVTAIQRTALNTSASSPPPEVSRIPGSLKAVAITGGSNHAFALLPDGTLRGWGLWQGEPATAPSSAIEVVQLDSTDEAALALRSDGKVIAWSPRSVANPVIFQAPGGRAPISVHAGPEGSGYALCSDGSVHAVGPAAQQPPTVMAVFTRLIFQPTTRGWCALQRDGSPLYWGAQLPGILPLPSGMRDLFDLDIASGFAVALQRDGTLTGWGKTAPDQSFRRRQFTGAVEVVHDHADRVFAVHRNDDSWELAPNPNIPSYVAEDRLSVLEGRLRGAIQVIFTREHVIALKP